VKPRFEYRYEDYGDEWGEFKGRRCWSMEDVANEVAEKYWDNEDRKTQMILCLK